MDKNNGIVAHVDLLTNIQKYTDTHPRAVSNLLRGEHRSMLKIALLR